MRIVLDVDVDMDDTESLVLALESVADMVAQGNAQGFGMSWSFELQEEDA